MKRLIYNFGSVVMILLLAASCSSNEDYDLIDSFEQLAVNVVDKDGNDLLDVNSGKCMLNPENLPVVANVESGEAHEIFMGESCWAALGHKCEYTDDYFLDYTWCPDLNHPYLISPTKWSIVLAFPVVEQDSREFTIDFKNGVQHKVGFRYTNYRQKGSTYYLDGKPVKNPVVIVMDTK